MAQYLGKPFKTYEGAQKRARFEQAHQAHLQRRYAYGVRQVGDVWRVVRTLVKEGNTK